jgi:hypothetical protein
MRQPSLINPEVKLIFGHDRIGKDFFRVGRKEYPRIPFKAVWGLQ